MTPKEKAEELLLKFSRTHIIGVANTKGKLVSPYSSGYASIIVRNDRAIQCSLIAVDEMISLSESMPEDIGRHYIWYLNEVKKQIEKL